MWFSKESLYFKIANFLKPPTVIDHFKKNDTIMVTTTAIKNKLGIFIVRVRKNKI